MEKSAAQPAEMEKSAAQFAEMEKSAAQTAEMEKTAAQPAEMEKSAGQPAEMEKSAAQPAEMEKRAAVKREEERIRYSLGREQVLNSLSATAPNVTLRLLLLSMGNVSSMLQYCYGHCQCKMRSVEQ